MSSEIKANKLSPGSGSILTIGDSGDTVNIDGTAGTGFPSTGFHNVKFITTSTNPVALTSGTTLIVVEVLGAGGCAGGSDSGGNYGGTGGAGGYSIQQLTVVDSDEFNVTIGSGGTDAGTRNGGDTIFASASGTSFNTITGGGGVGASNPSGAHNDGGAGGSVTNTNSGNKLNIAGASGSAGAVDKAGRDSRWGWGGSKPAAAAGAGGNAVGYGSSGGDSLGINQNGGDGGDGLVVIWEYK